MVSPYHDPKNRPLGTQKVKNDPEIKSKSKVRIERNIENESCSTTLVDPKTVFEKYSGPKYNQLGPQKAKTTPKSRQNQMSELKEPWEMKVVALYDYTPKQFLNLIPTPK